MPIFKFKNPLRTSGSDGFQTSITDQDGNVSTINVFSIGQDVGTDSNVEFDGVSQPEAQTAIIGTDANNMVLGYGFISGSNLQFTVDEQGISENYTHEDDITINDAEHNSHYNQKYYTIKIVLIDFFRKIIYK